ncbi:hypothetical protein H633G_00021 [Metarhizium anisopliae BRIP 53284]|nr:hypothetical protein H633G_00021 [Metarhizium anisopliae BRIP 53284]
MSSFNALPVAESLLNLRDPQCKENLESWQPILQKFEAASRHVTTEATPSSLIKHQSRGQLLARDRISLLLDEDSPFLELCAYAGFQQDDAPPCANLIAGIGSICARPCLVLSHIPTQSGGAWNEFTVPKQNRVTEIATENHLPIVALVQSAGVFLPQQFKVFHAGGQIFRDLARRSQLGQQSCAIVFGSSTAGGAYHPALSDYSIFVKDQAQVFDAIRKGREWVASLGQWPLPPVAAAHAPLPPRYSIEDILSIVDPDIRKPFNMREIILRLVDDSRLSEFKPSYGPNLLTCFANIMGHSVGIVANQVPVINTDEASKGAQFIRLCNQSNLPIVFLHNVTGFMVGTKAEHAAIIKKGAQLVSAVSCSTVPHISVILGASYGAGNYAMCGRPYKPRFLFTWPIGRCSVMGPDQLAGVMQTIEANSAKSKGKQVDGAAAEKRTQSLKDSVQRDSESYRTSAALLDDGVIDPRDTRDVVGMCLEVVKMPGVQGASAHRVLARM